MKKRHTNGNETVKYKLNRPRERERIRRKKREREGGRKKTEIKKETRKKNRMLGRDVVKFIVLSRTDKYFYFYNISLFQDNT
jgi:hypothetical protein